MTPRTALLLCALAPLGCGGGDSPVMQANPNGNYAQPMFTTISWDTNATAHRQHVGHQFRFHCPAGGTPGGVWGSNPYTDDSSICTAAVHRGVITFANGGNFIIEMRPGQASYTGTASNGITSQNYGAWGGSFVLVL